MDNTYLKEVAPLRSTVTADIDVVSIMELEAINQFVTVQMNLRLNWLDPRIEMVNLHEDENLNTLNAANRQRIWTPRVLFFNTEDKMTTKTDDEVCSTIFLAFLSLNV